MKKQESLTIKKQPAPRAAGVSALPAGVLLLTGLWGAAWRWLSPAQSAWRLLWPLLAAWTALTLCLLLRPERRRNRIAVLALLLAFLAGALLLAFLGTRIGLSIRATGDNTAMVRASSINPAFTITVGLCVSGALCALSGGLLAQYQKSCDINVGTGMVTIALASLIIGETLVGKRTMLRRILGVVFGSCLYRFIVAVALRFNVPAAAMKLVSAIIVAVAISMPAIREHFAFEKRKHAARARRAAAVKEGK